MARRLRPGVLPAALVVAGLAAAAVHAQDQQPVFRAGVDLVRVDVSVFDAQGRPVEDLQPADFHVEEDGVPQTVETVQFVRLDGQRASEREDSLEIRSREHAAAEAARDDVRLFAIFLDEYHVDKAPVITQRLRHTLASFVKQFGPNDLVAVMDPLTPLSHLPFTRNLAELADRMNRFEGRRGEYFPVRSAAEEEQMRSGNPGLVRQGVTLSALEALVTHLGGLRDTRATILFVSQGPAVNSPNNPNWHRFEDVLRAANRFNVTIHTLDPRPLGSSFPGSVGLLRQLAAETGGRAIVNTNDPTEALNQVIADASAYYLVGYSPTREVRNDGKFHRIDVRVARRGARVLHRRGYWAPAESDLAAAAEAAARTRDADLVAALAAVDQANVREVEVWVGAAPGASARTRLTVTWEPAPSRGTDAPVRLDIEPIDAHDGAARGEPATIAASTAGATGDTPVVAAFDVPPGPLALRFTARDTSGQTLDRWLQPLDVPEFTDEPVVLATPRFLRARSAFEFRAIRSNPSPVPSATRRFRRTDRVLVDVACGAPGGEAVQLSAALLNAEGEPLVELTVPPPRDGTARFELPVASLAPGTYVLRVTALAGAHEARQLSAFRMIP